ncbi:MAG TPA: LutB/LldF family L-lactate oxidation iron-sulfur protein [Phycisphaerae bacterium]|jgi:L-lactate dehydrogenase complex protein LldF|nr:iron-sulfur cluster-binding protein [Phycisphaerae bacterium]HOB74576.1 LutB/LldF family L-lactate oxidation iron-sulfur protein [Phycisphaerae bacterium]HOJ53531.1 LutB/LldF family L-lactate oxidation iron-sulfur protein [Phycisphaerae bacterium]HOL25312.1 LutB/LldF family L-lactate oxidation iron-sulfur protein [Phycisphaerae bacterium]HPP20473.1 LutB/LldF family L-lactate oxidation iron-sulfur protein [Phycisphaerae bacterium]
MTSTASKTSTVSETSTASETSTVSQTTSTHQAPTASNHSGTPNFRRSVALALANQRLGLAMDRATRRQDNARRTAMPELPDPMAARKLAARIKDHTLQNLDKYLAQLADNFRKHGGHVHFAHTAEQATAIITDIARRAKVKTIIKSKSMVSEEVHLDDHLIGAGFEVVETDLGEYIIQIDNDKPSHIVTPVLHKTKEDIAELFHRKLGIPYTTNPEELTAAARKVLREKFRTADMGITGVNFAVAETGALCMVTNEGNGRFCASRPRVLVSLMGMEKLVPRMKDLALFLKLLPRSATGQRITCYTSLMAGPRRPGDVDGPEEVHLVILDRGRTGALAGPYRQALRCIRCGACLNACPVYRKIGGHAYESVYPGPIGKLVTPLLSGLGPYYNLPLASSLCGACLEACPVRIDIPSMLINMRYDLLKRGQSPLLWRIGFKFWRLGMSSSLLYRMGAKMAGWYMRLIAHNGFVSKLPLDGKVWTDQRDIPAPAKRPFRARWDELMAEIEREEG